MQSNREKSKAYWISNLFMRYLPNSYILCLILTLLVFILAGSTRNLSFEELFLSWGNGFWSLLTFAMQMALILITGFTLARAPQIERILKKLSSFPKTSTSAALLVTFVSLISCFFNWGFGLIVAGLFALQMARTRKDTSFSLLIAGAYAGFLVWHGGLSGSIPLSLTQLTPEMKKIFEIDSIPLSETLFSPLNIALLIGVSLTVLLCVAFLNPKNYQEANNPLSIKEEKFVAAKINSFANFCENSHLFTLIISLISFLYVFLVLKNEGKFTLNLVIFIFLFLGIFLHKTPARFLFYFQNSIKQCSGIILQFPFYAGIMGLMKDSGLALIMSNFFIHMATVKTLPLFTYWSAGLINFFVPSGGGQWAIQGPIMMKAAHNLGVDPMKVAISLSWGDAWTNMIQPFWALPLLSLARLELKHIMGYLLVIFVMSGLVSSALFLLF